MSSSSPFDLSDLPDKESIEDYIKQQQEAIMRVAKPRLFYTVVVIVLLIAAATVFFGSTALVANGTIPSRILGNLALIALMLVIIALTCYFSGLRQANRQYRKAKNAIEVLNDALETGIYAGKFEMPEIVDDTAAEKAPADGQGIQKSGEEEPEVGGIAQRMTKTTSTQAMDEFFHIFERKVRNPLVPETDEYKKMRQKWRVIMAVGFGLMVLSLLLLYFFPSYIIGAGTLLVISYAVVIGGLVYDQKKLKPLRKAWARRSRMTEFEMRYDMDAVSQNNKYHKKKGAQ